VYSFDTSDPESDESEIHLLAKLADQTYEKFYSNLEAIRKKGLLQSRGAMVCAVTPSVGKSNRIKRTSFIY